MCRKNKRSGVWALLLCAALCIQLLPVSALASAEPTEEPEVLLVEELTTEEEISSESASEEPAAETSPEEPAADGAGTTYTLDENADEDIELEAENGAVYTFSGTEDLWEYNISVTLASGTATVVLENVNISGTVTIAPESGAAVILELSGENHIAAAGTLSAALHKTGEGTLILRGSGKLTATGKNRGAAIGGGSGESVENIRIEGGTVVAVAGKTGAAIGGGYNADAENIVIGGGSVTARSDAGACIGGGSGGGASGIIIEGGTVTAASSGTGAAVGSGGNASWCDTVHITGGTVTAHSAAGAAVGGGYSEEEPAALNDITISGGWLTLSAEEQRPIGDGAGSSSEGIAVIGGVFTLTDTCTAEFLETVTGRGLSVTAMSAALCAVGRDATAGAGKLTGGSFCFDPTFWTADGYSVTYGDGLWVIGQNGVFEVDGRTFAELQDAVEAVEESGTVALKDNGSISGQIIIPAGKSVTLALNGHSLTGGQSEALVENFGTLTVTEGSLVNVCDASDIGAVIKNGGTLTLSGTVLTTDGTYGLVLAANSAAAVTDGKVGTVRVLAEGGTETSLIITGGTVADIAADGGVFSCEISGGIFGKNPASDWLTVGTAAVYAKRSDGSAAYIVGKGVEQKNYRVTFGLFTFDPSEFAAEGYEIELLPDGRRLVQKAGTPVVQARTESGTETYNSLAAALLLSEGDTELTLLADDEEEASFYIDRGRKVSIDLAGHTVKIGSDTQYGYTFQNHGELTISDSSGDNSGVLWTASSTIWNYNRVTVTGGQLYADGRMVLFADEGSETVITDGRFISEYSSGQDEYSIQIYHRAKSFTMTGGEVNRLYLATYNNYVEVTLTGYLDTGIQCRDTSETEFPYQYGQYGFAEGYAPVQVYVDGRESLLLGKNVTLACGKVTGGTFSFDLSLYRPELLSYGYRTEYTEGTGWIVTDDPAVPVVASVGDAMCHTLSEALDTAQNGDTVTLLADVTLTETAAFSRWGAAVTLDLAGYTISGAMEDALLAVRAGEFTITDTSEEQTGRIQNTGVAVRSDKALIVRGGTFTSTESYALYVSKFSSAVTYGGSFWGASASVYAVTGGTTERMQLTAYGGSFGRLVISDTDERICLYGGLFTEEDPGRFVAEGCARVAVRKDGTGESAYVVGTDMTVDGDGKITGGVFRFDPRGYVKNGVKTTANRDGTWTVGYAAGIGAVKYPTLAEAVAAVQDGETVTMMADETLTGQIVSARSFTLELDGKVIDGDGKYGFTLFGTSVTVQDSTAVNEVINRFAQPTLQSTGGIRNCAADSDGKGGCICFCPGSDGGTLTVKKVIIRDCIANVGGGICVKSGTLVMDGGELADNTAEDDGGGVFVSDGAAMEFNAGVVRGNSARFGGGICVLSGTFTAVGGTVDGNTAEENGGGVYCCGTINADGLCVRCNTAGQLGGGICLNAVDGTLTHLDADGNRATEGGAVYMRDTKLEFSAADLRENTATCGGAVCIDGESGSTGVELTVTGLNPIRNAATYGGGIYIRSANLDLSQISYMTASYNTAEQGGLIYMESGSLTLSRGGSYNTATRGGGLVYAASGDLTIRYMTDSGSNTSGDGIGDILYLGGTMDSLTLLNSIFKGSLHLGSVTGTAQVRNCTFHEAVTAPDTISKPLFYPGRYLFFSRAAAQGSGKALLQEGRDYICTGSGDASWTVGGTAVAAVGENRYDTLSDAVSYAADGDTVELLADIVLPQPVTVDGKSLTLELAGRTITSDLTEAALLIKEGGGLTLRDSEGTGTILAKSAGVVSNSGTFTVESGTLSAKHGYVTVNCREGSVTDIRGGTLTSGGCSNSKPVIFLNGLVGTEPARLTVSGGVVDGKLGCTGTLVDMSLTGGVFHRVDPATVTGEDGSTRTTLAEGYGSSAIRVQRMTAYIIGQNVETENGGVIAGIFRFDPSMWTEGDTACVTRQEDVWIVHPHLGESERTAYSVSINVQYDLTVNFYVKLPEDVAETEREHYTVEAVFDGESRTFRLEETNWFDARDGYDRYRMAVAAEYSYQMGEPVHIRVYYDGYLLRSFSYSAAQYFLETMETSGDAALADFCRTALNYGANAQLYYSGKSYDGGTYPTYTAEELVNRSFNPDNIIETGAEDVVLPDTEVAGAISTVTEQELSLVVADETTMKLRLTVSDCDSLEEFCRRFSVECGGLKVLDYAEEGDHVFTVQLGGLYVDKFARSYTVRVTSGEESMEICCAAISYARTLAAEKSGEKLFCAFYEYIEAFEAYLAER